MKYQCEIIRDLMPLCVDEVASPETRAAVEQHRGECPPCAEYYAALAKGAADDAPTGYAPPADLLSGEVADYAQRVKRRRRRVASIIAAVVAALAIGLTLAVVACSLLLYGPKATTTSDPAQYGCFAERQHSGSIYSNLEIFPEDLPDGAVIDEYHYYWRDELFDSSVQIFASIGYEPEDFAAELERLSGITAEYEGETHSVIRDREHFIADAYVMAMHYNYTYEYAIPLPDEGRVVYVFTQFAGRSTLSFEDRWLPTDFHETSDVDSSSFDGYNQYYFDLKDVAGGRTTPDDPWNLKA